MRKTTLVIFIIACMFQLYGQNILNQQFEASKGKWEIPTARYTKLSENYKTINTSTSICAGQLD